MILVSSQAAGWLVLIGVCWPIFWLCVNRRVWLHASVLLVVMVFLGTVIFRDAARDRSADGGVFVRDAGSIIWRKAGSDD
jgi:drug/metabolite transporter superfamily protein YnfA